MRQQVRYVWQSQDEGLVPCFLKNGGGGHEFEPPPPFDR
jgi:hypothetical protein